MRVLAGDIGGTKTRLGVFEVVDDSLHLIQEKRYLSSEFGDFGEIVKDFVGRSDTEIHGACFGIAGPVTGRRVRVTNLQWVVDADDLGRVVDLDLVVLLNDLEATAWGLPEVAQTDLLILNEGSPDASGNGAVIAAGTGLGEAGLYWNGRSFEPFGCEGGHVSFSPTDENGDGLLRFLRQKFDTVSWERVVSGPGLADLYRSVLESAGNDEPGWFVEAEAQGDPVPEIVSAGLERRCEISLRTLQVFSRLYGEEAGNLALKMMATGGVWVGGGIAPKILPVLSDGFFMTGFLSKGRMRPLLEAMPVRVVLDDRAALLGAARRAVLACNP